MNKCLHCDKDTLNAKFCSRSCSATFNNNTQHWRNSLGFKPVKNCLNCSKICKNLYCSIKCQQNYKTTQLVESSTASSQTMKKYLLKLYGNKCFECGIIEWNNKPITMDIEHVDGNSINNKLDNLKLLCPNCHSQTSTYKAKNKGNGRYIRRLRYSLDKSY